MSCLLPIHIEKGAYRVRFAEGNADRAACQALRYRAFQADRMTGVDIDEFDAVFSHFLIEDLDATPLCCFRLYYIPHGTSVGDSYSAKYYGLSAIENMDGSKLELGRFCIDPTVIDPNLVRLAWAAITTIVDRYDVKILFGCSSFAGTEAKPYEDAFALLKERHLAPKHLLPCKKAPQTYYFAEKLRQKVPELKVANATLPPLLRTYLGMGGWVSDHAVVDYDLNTLHVFTGVEVNSIPQSRKRLLRMDAA